ncbi:S8 family serine peptidase [Rudanella paleaurantiibacter]|uniref:S8 family serine peptidase n=1 Tax=Rudanella paleaurantiibacter TaxID=2614655 RepID=A0A7J5U162_9BACT|nr:S8 family serine peptidase [Rudanella paleaurantiibacter]KAB7731281.1 S8 family serine peptidase [Rudanella paleaurantiibacter]
MTIRKTILLTGLALSVSSLLHAQPGPARRPLPKNWSHLDPAKDSIAGISLSEAYELLKGRTSQPVIVGIIDSGVDIEHEDLKDVIWKNPKETPDNNIDEDKNGYTDDVTGWNFMGAKDGTTYETDQEEVTQIYVLWKDKYDKADPKKLKGRALEEYAMYQKAKERFEKGYKANEAKRLAVSDSAKFFAALNTLKPQLQGKPFEIGSINALDAGADPVTGAVKSVLGEVFTEQFRSFEIMFRLLERAYPRLKDALLAETKKTFNPDIQGRKMVGDNPADPNERFYGSPKLIIGDSEELAMHGTHVAGIVGAKRGNNLGVDGIADNVRIMTVAVVPSNGDERDKDVANGIRYAVDNGAKVINMSFGKRFSPFKPQVDAAIRYAEERDVLIVHASGNNAENYDSIPAYPRPEYEDGTTARNFMTVGNSTAYLNEGLPARSSNYGSRTVDLFAPGSDIESTIPRNNYAAFTGTSMAAPCVAGVAALLRSYFPNLTAVQVKEILMKSVYKPQLNVLRPSSQQRVPFSSLSVSGGIVNAAQAVKLAQGK